MFSSSSDYIKQENHIIYDFHDQLMRPYWTYFANKDIFKFHLINSASGFYGFKYKGAYPTDTMFHHLCNWNNYYVDSLIFFEHLKNIIPSCILLDEKISPFHISEKIPIVKNNKIKISIFDVVPHHLYSRALMLPEDRYRVSSTCIQFLTDILKCLENEDVIIYLKTKHYLNSDRYPDDYVTFIEKINNNNIVKINPRYSPKLISLNSHFSISSPFTTAAFYKTIYNYNFFYDPSNIIYKDDRARQNLKLISGYSELENYLDDIIKDIKLTMNKDNKLIV